MILSPIWQSDNMTERPAMKPGTEDKIMTATQYHAIQSRILELEYQLMNIDELEGFEAEAAALQAEINRLGELVADIKP